MYPEPEEVDCGGNEDEADSASGKVLEDVLLAKVRRKGTSVSEFVPKEMGQDAQS